MTVLVDAATRERLKQHKANSVAIYTESLTAQELADLFGKLCADDAKISPRVFDALHATPASQADGRELRELLGIDPGLFKRPTADKSEKHNDPGKPLSAGTADHIVKSVTA